MTRTEALPRTPALAKLNLVAVGIIACALVVHLWPEWTHDPDLTHGFLMPFIAVYQLWVSRAARPRDTLGVRNSVLLTLALGFAAFLVLFTAGLFATTLDWASPVVDFTLACSFALLGCAALAAFSSVSLAWVPFNWTSLCAALLWPLCSPFPPGSYARLTVGLQLWVSSGVMRTLDFLGVAAHRQGNIIELARGSVGVEEACSGVRSLISCVFVGILFSAALCQRTAARLLVIILSVPLALAMNFLRSLVLTLLVNAGVKVEGPWHDLTGYSVLLVTAGLLFWLATALDGRFQAAPVPAAPLARPSGRGSPSTPALTAVLSLTAALLAVFAAHTSSSPDVGRPVPDLNAMLPAAGPGWTADTTEDLYRFSGTLRTSHLAQRSFSRADASGTEQVTLYVAYWEPGQASVGLVGAHTPDACWPGAGWVARDVADPHAVLTVNSAALPAAQHRLFMDGTYPQEVWFWQLYQGRVVQVGNPRSVPALIRIALKFGFRKGGEQAFVRVSSNRPWADIAQEGFVRDFFARTRVLGLY